MVDVVSIPSDPTLLRPCPGCDREIPPVLVACGDCLGYVPLDVLAVLDSADPYEDTSVYLRARRAAVDAIRAAIPRPRQELA